jgi:hypothetical protein
MPFLPARPVEPKATNGGVATQTAASLGYLLTQKLPIAWCLRCGMRAKPRGGSCSCPLGLYFAVPRFRRGDQCTNERTGGGGNFIDSVIKGSAIGPRRTVKPAEFPNELK